MDDDVGPVFGEQIGHQARHFDPLVDGRETGILKQIRLAAALEVRIVIVR